MEKINPWKQIPLEDYEQHMDHLDVGQSKLINELTAKYLNKYNPKTVLFLGVSGGNGLEHIDADNVESVCAIDINDSYLEKTRKRFGEKIKQLKLINADVGSSNISCIKAEFVWAALIFEYVDIEKCFQFITNNSAQNSRLVVTIQSNNGAGSVSKTGIESVKAWQVFLCRSDRTICKQKRKNLAMIAVTGKKIFYRMENLF